MSFYKNRMIVDGEEYILYGFEGNIAIWQLKKATQASKRIFYANPGHEIRNHSVREIRKMINDYLEENA